MSIPEIGPQPPDRVPAPAYDASYYAHYYSGLERVPYERTQQWLSFFGTVAERVVSDIGPATALDVGCAHGFLVEALRDRGVDAKGFDISEFAISQVRDDVRAHCWVGSILEPIPGRYDLVTCVETLEHLDAKDADRAVEHICAITDDVLFSSTPSDYLEQTHVNVRPPEYWAELFARHGFAHDVLFDGSFLTWWASRFRRIRDPWHRLVVDYEREWWRLGREAHERNALILSQEQRIGALESQVEALSESPHVREARRLAGELAQNQARMAELDAEVAVYRSSRLFRLAAAARSAIGRAAPPGSQRRRLITALAEGLGFVQDRAPQSVAKAPRRKRGSRP
jgi:hypothetical protein